MTTDLKLYIAVLDEVPDPMVPVLVAHSVLRAHLDFVPYEDTYKDWLRLSFKKVVLKMNRKEFTKLQNSLGCLLYFGYENTVLNGEPSCIVVCPQETYPNVIKFANMWKPALVSNS